eukprot:4626025-Amphidinium_carterae.1
MNRLLARAFMFVLCHPRVWGLFGLFSEVDVGNLPIALTISEDFTGRHALQHVLKLFVVIAQAPRTYPTLPPKLSPQPPTKLWSGSH